MIVLICHIPFIFFAGKEGVCILIDETQRKSISNVLFHKLKAIPAFQKESMLLPAPNPNLDIPFTNAFDRASMGAEDLRKSAIANLTLVPACEANRMAYKDMNYCGYIAITLILYALQMIGALVVNDISTVFEFISAIAVTCVGFWFPAHYYLLAEKKYGKDKPQNVAMHVLSYCFYGVGLFNFIVGMFAAVLNILGAH